MTQIHRLGTPTGVRRFTTTDDSACEICGIRFDHGVMETEMYDPRTGQQSVVCHRRCGIVNGLKEV